MERKRRRMFLRMVGEYGPSIPGDVSMLCLRIRSVVIQTGFFYGSIIFYMVGTCIILYGNTMNSSFATAWFLYGKLLFLQELSVEIQ